LLFSKLLQFFVNATLDSGKQVALLIFKAMGIRDSVEAVSYAVAEM
jgi:hypothetical protein